MISTNFLANYQKISLFYFILSNSRVFPTHLYFVDVFYYDLFLIELFSSFLALMFTSGQSTLLALYRSMWSALLQCSVNKSSSGLVGVGLGRNFLQRSQNNIRTGLTNSEPRILSLQTIGLVIETISSYFAFSQIDDFCVQAFRFLFVVCANLTKENLNFRSYFGVLILSIPYLRTLFGIKKLR